MKGYYENFCYEVYIVVIFLIEDSVMQKSILTVLMTKWCWIFSLTPLQTLSMKVVSKLYVPLYGSLMKLLKFLCKLSVGEIRAFHFKAVLENFKFWAPHWEASLKGVGRKIFRGGPIRMEPVLTTKNGRIFEIWELLERVCENPGGGPWPPPAPPCRRPWLA